MSTRMPPCNPGCPPVVAPPPPAIQFAHGTPSNQKDQNGQDIPATVTVTAQWLNAPVGGGNSVKIEYYLVVNGVVQPKPFSSTYSPLGAAGSKLYGESRPAGTVIQAKIYLYNNGGTLLDSKVSANYTIK